MLQDYLTAAKSTFKDYTELRAQVNSTKHVTLISGNMTTNTQQSIGGVSARVYRGGTYGFASGAEYSPESVKSIIEAATTNALFMDKHVNLGKPPLPSLKNAPPKIGLQSKIADPIQQNKLIDFTKELDEFIVKKYKNISARTLVSNVLEMEKLLAVSEGTDGHWNQLRSMIYVSLTAETNDGTPVELFKSYGGIGKYDELFTSVPAMEAELDQLYEHLMNKREGIYPEAGLKKCILHPNIAGMLAHEAVGHTVEADIVLAGSVASTNVGKMVASELVSMVDYAHTAMGKTCPMPVYVDDEGVEAKDAVLIENGALKSFLHNRETARHFDVEPNGCARAFEFSDEPLIRMRNTAILPGKDKLDDLIASIDDGYLLIESGNGQADTTGEFMFSVDLGYEIKSGKIGKGLKDTTISGVAFEMLKTVDMVSDDMVWACGGFCGKKQAMTNSMGGPALRCDITLGGR